MALTLSSAAGVLLRLPDHSPAKPAVTPSSSISGSSKSFPLSRCAPKTPIHFIIAAKESRIRVSASVSSHDTGTPTLSSLTESQPVLIGSTRTVTTVVTLAIALSRLFLNPIQKLVGTSFLPNSSQLFALRALRSNLVHSTGPLFFAARTRSTGGYLNTPMVVVAAGIAKWLRLYSGILLVRVLLSWFPNIPWDRQPLSAIRDLCDPFLGLFRNVIPPVFGALDVSPLLAFAVLGLLSSVLNSSTH